MFGIIKNLTRAAVAVAVSPIDMAVDVVTLGGLLNDEDESRTRRRLRQAGDALDEAIEGRD